MAIEKENHSFADIGHIKDLGRTFLEELEEFFANDHQLSCEKYRILGAKGPAGAIKRLKDGLRAFKKK